MQLTRYINKAPKTQEAAIQAGAHDIWAGCSNDEILDFFGSKLFKYNPKADRAIVRHALSGFKRSELVRLYIDVSRTEFAGIGTLLQARERLLAEISAPSREEAYRQRVHVNTTLSEQDTALARQNGDFKVDENPNLTDYQREILYRVYGDEKGVIQAYSYHGAKNENFCAAVEEAFFYDIFSKARAINR